MTIYLYKKTHRVTGLKYLGKTVSKDPHLYKGSGLDWRKHIDQYGYNVETEILKECKTTEELKVWGMYYSKLWNIVESDDWANLKEEAGPGGRWTNKSKENLSKTNQEILAKLTPSERSERMKNSCCRSDTYTIERSQNISKSLTGRLLSNNHKSNISTGASIHRQSLTQEEKNNTYGKANKGKTWKIVNGKRVWVEKENQNY